MGALQESISKIREALLADETLYNGFVASILSAIEDINKRPDGMTDEELARHVADRVIGVE